MLATIAIPFVIALLAKKGSWLDFWALVALVIGNFQESNGFDIKFINGMASLILIRISSESKLQFVKMSSEAMTFYLFKLTFEIADFNFSYRFADEKCKLKFEL